MYPIEHHHHLDLLVIGGDLTVEGGGLSHVIRVIDLIAGHPLLLGIGLVHRDGAVLGARLDPTARVDEDDVVKYPLLTKPLQLINQY